MKKAIIMLTFIAEQVACDVYKHSTNRDNGCIKLAEKALLTFDNWSSTDKHNEAALVLS